jgi:hypothetical protein
MTGATDNNEAIAPLDMLESFNGKRHDS